MKSRIFACLLSMLYLSTPVAAYAQDATPPSVPTKERYPVASSTTTPSSHSAMATTYADMRAKLLSEYQSQGADPSMLSSLASLPAGQSFAQAWSTPQGVTGAVASAGEAWATEFAKKRSDMLTSMGVSADVEASSRAMGTLLASASEELYKSLPSASLAVSASGPAWESALAKAAKSAADVSKAKNFDPCLADMVSAAAGVRTKSSCPSGSSACKALGSYYFDALKMDSNVTGVLPPSEFNQFQPWLRDALGRTSPSSSSVVTGPKPGCGATEAVSQTAQAVLPGAWAGLTVTKPQSQSSQNNIPSGWGALRD